MLLRITAAWSIVALFSGVALADVIFPPPPWGDGVPHRWWVAQSGLWNNGENWSDLKNGPPGAGEPEGHVAHVEYEGASDEVITFVSSMYSPPDFRLAGLSMNASGAGAVLLRQTQDTLAAVQELISGRIVVEQSGGVHYVEQILFLGLGGGVAPVYNLSGTGSLSTSHTSIGDLGVGIFRQSGGSHSVAHTLVLGNEVGNAGTYELSGTGTLTVGDNMFVGAGGAGLFNHFAGTNAITHDLVLGNTWSGTGAYDLRDGHLIVGRTFVGNDGTASFYQSGGTHTVGSDLVLGRSHLGSGTYQLSGGTVTAGRVYVGDQGAGAVTHTGGSLQLTDILYMAFASGGTGTYDLSGTASLSPLAEIVGYGGTATFHQSGGTHALGSYILLGHQAGADGTYELTSGTLTTVDSEIVGYFGQGLFRQTGGTNTIRGGSLSLGQNAGGSGRFELSDNAVLNSSGMVVGNAGRGTLVQTGGTIALTDTLIISYFAGSEGLYTISGGSLAATTVAVANLGASGTLSQNGGTVTVRDRLAIGNIVDSRGIYRLGGTGQLSAANADVGNFGHGVFEQTGGSFTVAGDLRIQIQASATGEYTLAGGSLNVQQVVNRGFFRYSGGTFTGNLTNYDHVILSGPGTRIIDGDVLNEGTFIADNTQYEVTGTFRGNAAIISDPSNGKFAQVIIGPNGYIVAGVGDAFYVSGDLEINSTRSDLWDTRGALLGFVTGADPQHMYSVNGIDRGGASVDGYLDNFAWGTLFLASGNSLNLVDGDGSPDGAIYVRVLQLEDGVAQLANIQSNGLRIYYLGSLPENAYLAGQTFPLPGGGELSSVVPEPTGLSVLAAGMIILGTRRRSHFGRAKGKHCH